MPVAPFESLPAHLVEMQIEIEHENALTKARLASKTDRDRNVVEQTKTMR